MIPILKLPRFFTTYTGREKAWQFQNWNYFWLNRVVLILSLLFLVPMMNTVNSWLNAIPWLTVTATSLMLTARASSTDHHRWGSASASKVVEHVSRLPSTAKAALPLAKVDDWSAGLNRATFIASSTSTSKSRRVCLCYMLGYQHQLTGGNSFLVFTSFQIFYGLKLPK